MKSIKCGDQLSPGGQPGLLDIKRLGAYLLESAVEPPEEFAETPWTATHCVDPILQLLDARGFQDGLLSAPLGSEWLQEPFSVACSEPQTTNTAKRPISGFPQHGLSTNHSPLRQSSDTPEDIHSK